jgi:hypothetical protein
VPYPTLQQRPFEAESLACAGCHAPLPVNPLAPAAYCPHCHATTVVPEALRARAVEYRQWMREARALEQCGTTEAQANLQAVSQLQATSAVWVYMIATSVVPMVLGALGFVAYWGVLGLGAMTRALLGDLLTDDAIDYLNVAVVLIVLVAILLGLGALFVAWRWHQHRRRVGRAERAGYAPGPAFASHQPSGARREPRHVHAVCSVCGGPVEFQAGQQEALCAYCGSTVMPGPAQQRGFAILAFREAKHAADLATWRAARAQLRATRNTQGYYVIYLGVVMGGVLIIPFVIAGAVVVLLLRVLTHGVQDAIDDFAVSIGSELERGLGLPFDWLDTYWPAKAPEGAEYVGGVFTLRWSTHTRYGGRPVLVSAGSGWRDRVADRVVILMAHPALRSPTSIARGLASSAAAHAARLGYQVAVDDAGVVLAARDVPGAWLTVPALHQLVACAYGVAGASLP